MVSYKCKINALLQKGKSMTKNTDRVGVLTVGMGAVATTFLAGIFAIKKGLGAPVGALSEMGSLPLANDKKTKTFIKDALPLLSFDQMAFGGWEIVEDNAFEMAQKSGVLDRYLLEQVKEELSEVRPMPAVFDPSYVQFLEGDHVKTETDKWKLAQSLRADIRNFKEENNCDRVVVVWCASTENYVQPSDEHETIEAFEKALKENSDLISPSMLYTYAAIQEGAAYANGAPNTSVELKALQDLAIEKSVPVTGSDFKTGQTLMKTIIAPGLKSRMLGVDGWFSTNILGNRDGKVLQSPGSFKSKEVSKLGVLDDILEPEDHPELYGELDHAVRINYYKPRGDNKEGWDNIDIHGWLGYPMQIKVNFLCRDSILAAPIVLDLVQFLDLAQRSGQKGIQEWMGFYWKSPLAQEGEKPVHALHVQEQKLFDKLIEFKEFFESKGFVADKVTTKKTPVAHTSIQPSSLH